MTSRSEIRPLMQREQGDYGFARVRDQAFDAVQTLWRRRQVEGMRQKDIAAFLGRKPAWVSRNLGAPGNWTLRTFGEFMQALGGEAEVQVHAVEDAVDGARRSDAYDGYNEARKANASGKLNISESVRGLLAPVGGVDPEAHPPSHVRDQANSDR